MEVFTMLDLRQAQIISRKVTNEYKKTINPIKWTDVYNSEAVMLEDLKNICIPEKQDLLYIGQLYTGYEFIHSFAKQLQNGKTLSEKQIIQCKRLALEIKKAVSVKNCFR